MNQKKYSESQILKVLKSYDSGISAVELSRQYGVNRHTIYDWKKKYGNISNVSELEKLRALQRENEKLKKMYANLSLENESLKDVIEKKL